MLVSVAAAIVVNEPEAIDTTPSAMVKCEELNCTSPALFVLPNCLPV
ncbi:MAG: hypothetical protein ACFFG0_04435 [Candidatus Thorarchaeota archaeon]